MPDYDGTAGSDVYHGSEEDERINGSDGDDSLFGHGGRDELHGGSGDDLLDGGAGMDFLLGMEGDDRLRGGDGNDFLRGGEGTDHFDGGADDGPSTSFNTVAGDTVTFFQLSTSEGIVADLRTGIITNDGFGNRETMVAVEGLSSHNPSADTLWGDDSANYLLGGTNDIIESFGGDDFLALAGAAFLLDGGDGLDTLFELRSRKYIPDSDGDGRPELVSATAGVTVDLTSGFLIDAFGDQGSIANVENFCGSETGADDVLRGNEGDNIIRGLGGSDRISGEGGIDTLSYATTGVFAHYSYDSGASAVEVDLKAGFAEESEVREGSIRDDSVRTGRDVLSGIENIVATGLGDRLYGNDQGNVIAPGAGNDVVNGRGGTDTVDYSIARASVSVDLAAGTASEAGTGAPPHWRLVSIGGEAGLNYVYYDADDAKDSTDRLVSIENAIGSDFSDLLSGSSAANHLQGLRGRDILAGIGGGNLLDGGAGIDRADYASAPGAVMVDLAARTGTIAGVAASDRLVGIEDATGSAFADTLIGSAGANRLDGGAGIDRMDGGLGNDVYVIDDSRDMAAEAAGAGTDRVESFVTLTLGTNLEHLTLIGDADISGIGNGKANQIVGNAGSNLLDGAGGGDVARGGAGNDIYRVGDLADKALEALNQGSDRVDASISFTLSRNVERLVLTGGDDLAGTGNAGSNRIVGNAGANVLAGLGGGDLLEGAAGNDRLAGGTGNDRLEGGDGLDSFLFDTALNGRSNVDTILDFSAADDTIRLDRDVFAGISDGRLAASAFNLGAQASDASDRILYDQASGKIFYDADGIGGLAAILFASVDAGTVLTNADFVGYI
jgi:Ca2+-binding RTX toxin-like protein